MRALCKLGGRLVVAEFSLASDRGHCPLCWGADFIDAPHGWIECDKCHDYSILKSDYEKISKSDGEGE